jgi:hypothetical protein
MIPSLPNQYLSALRPSTENKGFSCAIRVIFVNFTLDRTFRTLLLDLPAGLLRSTPRA